MHGVPKMEFFECYVAVYLFCRLLKLVLRTVVGGFSRRSESFVFSTKSSKSSRLKWVII